MSAICPPRVSRESQLRASDRMARAGLMWTQPARVRLATRAPFGEAEARPGLTTNVLGVSG
jgi:hypothetical protein